MALLLARLRLWEKEKELIFKHLGHSENINKNKYQAVAGSMQLQTTGKQLQEEVLYHHRKAYSLGSIHDHHHFYHIQALERHLDLWTHNIFPTI